MNHRVLQPAEWVAQRVVVVWHISVIAFNSDNGRLDYWPFLNGVGCFSVVDLWKVKIFTYLIYKKLFKKVHKNNIITIILVITLALCFCSFFKICNVKLMWKTEIKERKIKGRYWHIIIKWLDFQPLTIHLIASKIQTIYI